MINENEAPEGFKAVPAFALCGKCKFLKKKCEDMPEVRCTPNTRQDHKLVIFVKK